MNNYGTLVNGNPSELTELLANNAYIAQKRSLLEKRESMDDNHFLTKDVDYENSEKNLDKRRLNSAIYKRKLAIKSKNNS